MPTTPLQQLRTRLSSAPKPAAPQFAENYRPYLKSTTTARVSPSTPAAAAGVAPAAPLPADPLTDFLALIASELAAADANLLARRFALALDGYDKVINDIDNWRAARNPDSAQLSADEKLAFNGILDGEQGIGNYVPLESLYLFLFGRATDATPADQAFYGLKLATVYLDWGNSQFRNDQTADALKTYQNILAADGTIPASPYFQLPGFKAAADSVTTVANNLAALLGGSVTATALNVNPVLAATVVEIHQNLVKIQNGLDFWGHWHNTIPIWTFEYLQGAAINFAQFAINAERDFINFQERSDQGSATRQQLAQLASQASAEIDASKAQAAAVAAEAQAYAKGADLANQRASDAQANANEYAQTSALSIQFDALRSQISGGDGESPEILNGLADTFLAGGSVTVSDNLNKYSDLFGVYSRNNVAAGDQLAAAKLTRQYEVDSLQRTSNEMNIAAQQGLLEAAAAQARVAAANAATAVATLHAEAAQQNLQAFDSQTFTPDVWQRMADTMWRLYRRYLDMALKTALLMQQAYNFETDQSLRFIKKDYSTDEVKGLLGADALMADIQSFTYDLITSTTGKSQPVRQSISLAQRYAYLFETQFRRTGLMEFETRIDDFDNVYPGTYAGRIESVDVEVVGLVPPSGVSGTLTNSGVSGYRTPASAAAPGSSGLKYRLQPKETLVLSDYSARVDSGLIPTDLRVNGIFQGSGLVSSWRLELPREINDIDYGALLDVRLTFYYKARYDPDLHDKVITELAARPGILERHRGIQLRWIYPDAFFRFQDTGVLAFSQREQDFASNETAPVLTAVGLVIATNGTVSPRGLAVQLSTPGMPAALASADADGQVDSGAAGSPWATLINGSALGDYTLTMTAQDNPGLLKAGHLDLSPIVNMALILGYSFTPKGAPARKPLPPVGI